MPCSDASIQVITCARGNVNFFSGSQLAVAIEDLASQELFDSEDILGDRIAREISKLLPLRTEDVPRKLINGFMRGSTTIKDDLLAREFIILQSSLNDRQDPMLLVSIVKNEVQRERKDIHIKRTQKSAVRQILRALKEDINSVSTTRPGMEASFVKTQQELLLQDIRQQDQLIDWAMRTQRLYEDLFVDYENTDSSSSFKPKGIVSRLAASNYGNSWMKFINEHAHQILAIAPTSKPLMSNSMIESTFRPDMFSSIHPRNNSSESIRVSIRNGGQGILQTWASKAEARKELPSFISLLSTLVDADNEIESVEISLAATNEININLKGVTQSKVEQTLTKLLS